MHDFEHGGSTLGAERPVCARPRDACNLMRSAPIALLELRRIWYRVGSQRTPSSDGFMAFSTAVFLRSARVEL